jgi:hypothetical protein
MHRDAFNVYLDAELLGIVGDVQVLIPGGKVEVIDPLREGAPVKQLFLVGRLREDDQELLGVVFHDLDVLVSEMQPPFDGVAEVVGFCVVVVGV